MSGRASRGMSGAPDPSPVAPAAASRAAAMPACTLARSERPTPESLSPLDRKSTRLNSSHSQISDAVFCLKKKICADDLVRLRNECNGAKGLLRLPHHVRQVGLVLGCLVTYPQLIKILTPLRGHLLRPLTQ